ncbi:glycoside hydrolase superfamily [Pilobolus umbonatus]|nr:glycoside hydrolase superfamily [Pilobolus umbonatus]
MKETPVVADHSIQPLSWTEAYEKAHALVDTLSLEDKVGLTTGVGWQKGPCVGNIAKIKQFPGLCLQDAPLGVRFTQGVSSGIAGINAAASFDKLAIRQRGVYMGKEFRAKGIHAQLGPSMNMLRVPEGGRNWEAFGEDPYLVGVAAYETIQGIQSQGVMAVAKHLIGNEQETNRELHSVSMDDRTMHEVYMWPFARSVEAGVASVMCSYNKYDTVYTCENEYVMNTLLKEELDFKGFIQSDWSATHSTVDSANHGLDMTMPGDITFFSGDSYFGANLTRAVEEGEVTEERVTDMATRIVAAWYKLGQDENFPDTNFDSFKPSPQINVQENHKEWIRSHGAASIVLLKNEDNILPLRQSSLHKIAVVGSDAHANLKESNCEDHGCHKGTLAQGWGSGTAQFPYLISPVDGIKARAGNNIDILEHLEDSLEGAIEAASKVDIAFVFVNANSGEAYINVEGHQGDRNHLRLWNNGDALIEAVATVNANTVVVVHSVGPVQMEWADHPHIKAIVWAGLLGQESGNSLADILFGDINPSGRLPYTIAKNIKDYPATTSKDMNIYYEEGLYVGYRWFDQHKIEPLYEFGYGLSYTYFVYSPMEVSVYNHPGEEEVHLSIQIQNIGLFDGSEIPQLYLSFPEIAKEPPKLLRGFEKVFLKRHTEQTVQFKLTKQDLSYWNSHSWEIARGKYVALIGSSSRNIKAEHMFVL